MLDKIDVNSLNTGKKMKMREIIDSRESLVPTNHQVTLTFKKKNSKDKIIN